MDVLCDKTRRAFSGARNEQLMVDWFRVITELRGRGHSLETIAKHIGVHKTTVHAWTNGSTPNYMDGVELMELWEATITKVPLTISNRRNRLGK